MVMVPPLLVQNNLGNGISQMISKHNESIKEKKNLMLDFNYITKFILSHKLRFFSAKYVQTKVYLIELNLISKGIANEYHVEWDRKWISYQMG